jgi:hypothetical protein
MTLMRRGFVPERMTQGRDPRTRGRRWAGLPLRRSRVFEGLCQESTCIR